MRFFFFFNHKCEWSKGGWGIMSRGFKECFGIYKHEKKITLSVLSKDFGFNLFVQPESVIVLSVRMWPMLYL